MITWGQARVAPAARGPRFAQGSKRNADAQLRLMALEIGEIERARASGDRSPDLHVPRRREETSLAKGRIQGRSHIDRLACECIEAEPLVVAKVACFRADEDVWHHLHRERCSDAQR